MHFTLKILLSILLAIFAQSFAFYPSNQQLQSKRHYALSLNGPNIQLQYGTPNKLTQSSNIKIPGGITIEDLIRLTEKLQSENKFHYARPYKPQKVFRPAEKQILPPTDYKTIPERLTPPRTSYGVPIQPQIEYGVPNSDNVEHLNRYHTLPRPNQANNFQSNNYNEFSIQHLPVKRPAQFRPQNTQLNNVNFNQNHNYIPPIQNFNKEVPNQGSFGSIPKHPQDHFNPKDFNNGNQQPNDFNPHLTPVVPNEGNIQNFNSQSPYSNTNFAQIPMNSNFQPTQTNSLNNNRANAFGRNPTRPNGRYVPPTTTVRNVFTQVSTERPEQSTVVATTDGSQEENNNQFTESPPTAVDSQDPNVSIATAVSGADPSLFYLQQPDGRLQKVILQKTQDSSGKPEEYTANYYFQNIEAVPNVVYSPLITLG